MTHKILVVETNAPILEMLHEILTGEGSEVRTTNDGYALHYGSPFHPDLVLMDVLIPEMARQCGQNSPDHTAPTHDIPIILMTAQQRKPHMTQALVIDFVFSNRSILTCCWRKSVAFWSRAGPGKTAVSAKRGHSARAAHANTGVPDTYAGSTVVAFLCAAHRCSRRVKPADTHPSAKLNRRFTPTIPPKIPLYRRSFGAG